MQKITERYIEEQLVKTVKAHQGLCLKLNSISLTGLPDRLVLLPGGKCAFVEVKRPGEKLRPIQVKRIKQLMQLGFLCYMLDDLTQIVPIIEEVSSSGV